MRGKHLVLTSETQEEIPNLLEAFQNYGTKFIIVGDIGADLEVLRDQEPKGVDVVEDGIDFFFSYGGFEIRFGAEVYFTNTTVVVSNQSPSGQNWFEWTFIVTE